MTRQREEELALLFGLATLRATHAQAALGAIDLRISEIRDRITDARAPVALTQADLSDANAADRWVSARQARVATLNSALARALASRAGAAGDAARASAVEEVLKDALQTEKSNAVKSGARRSEETSFDTRQRR